MLISERWWWRARRRAVGSGERYEEGTGWEGRRACGGEVRRRASVGAEREGKGMEEGGGRTFEGGVAKEMEERRRPGSIVSQLWSPASSGGGEVAEREMLGRVGGWSRVLGGWGGRKDMSDRVVAGGGRSCSGWTPPRDGLDEGGIVSHDSLRSTSFPFRAVKTIVPGLVLSFFIPRSESLGRRIVLPAAVGSPTTLLFRPKVGTTRSSSASSSARSSTLGPTDAFFIVRTPLAAETGMADVCRLAGGGRTARRVERGGRARDNATRGGEVRSG